MLILSRKIEETIRVPGVTFKILGIRGDIVKVGVEAAKDVQILRGELVGHVQAAEACSAAKNHKS